MRPFVFVNVAMSADGKISTAERRQVRISGDEDYSRVDRVKAESDAIMVGIGSRIQEGGAMKFWDVVLFLLIFNLMLGVVSSAELFSAEVSSDSTLSEGIGEAINNSTGSPEQTYGVGDILMSLNLLAALHRFVWIDGFLQNLGMPAELAHVFQVINWAVYLIFMIQVIRGFRIE